ncbi:MAG: iron-sulfur cluster repair di-iron protein [Elusimicrobia bacterium]|nr:iron-sulfur cluster repair di-iron protein [Elusimicrobiota bacterium]
MNINNDMTVGEMATLEHKSIAVFKELGIDFCCGGKQNLKKALKEKNITAEAFITKLEKLKKTAKKEVDFKKMTPRALAGYIDDKHHAYLHKALPEIGALAAKVLGVHGARHQELFEIYKLFGRLKTDLEQHLIKEETMLFPAITDLNKNEKLKKLAREIKKEHEEAGALLDDIRVLTHNYNLPDDACMSFENLYDSLQEMEDDLHEHIHLENNILLKNIV